MPNQDPCPRCGSGINAKTAHCNCGFLHLSLDGEPAPERVPAGPRPVTVTIGMVLLLAVAVMPGLQLLLGGYSRASYFGPFWYVLPLFGFAVNVAFVILLWKPRMWVMVLAALRGVGGVVWSLMQLQELRTQWGEWSFSLHSGIMTWLLVNAVLGAGIALMLFWPSSIRWTR